VNGINSGLCCFPLPSSFIVDVTKEDIEHGTTNNCRTCPIARAGLRALDLPSGAFEVYGWSARAGSTIFEIESLGLSIIGNTSYHCLYGDTADKFVSDFDNGKPVKPVSLTYVLTRTYSHFWKKV